MAGSTAIFPPRPTSMPTWTPSPSSSAPPRWNRRWRCRGSCPKAGGKMGKRNPRGKPLGFWRSIRDLNSGGAVNALSHFECDLFDLLSNAPYEIVRQARRVGYRRSPTTPYYTKKFPARQEKFDAPGFLFFYNFAMPLAVAGMDCITPGGNGAVGVIEIGNGPGVEHFGLSVAAHGAAHAALAAVAAPSSAATV